MKYAQIIKEKVHWIGHYEKQPEFHPSAGAFIPLPDDKMIVNVGDKYKDGAFISSDTETPANNIKTIYTKVDFLNKIPRALRQQIKAEELAGNPSVIDWVFIMNAMLRVDLNNLPDGFTIGLYDMVDNPNINLTKGDVDNFLEI